MKQKCENCNGSGTDPIAWSCCGDDITNADIDLCPSCKEHCSTTPEDDCEECGGTGEVEIDEPDDDDIFNGFGMEGGINYKPEQPKKIR